MTVTQEDIQNAKILVIDDDDLTVKLLGEILQKAGYKNVTVLQDSRKAASQYRNLQPDLVILDLNMPHLDGFQVMHELGQVEEGYLPVIILSGEESKDKHYLALESGAKDFLNKPFGRVEVLIRIRNLIEVRLLHNETRDQNKILEDKVKERTQELYDTQLDVIQRLARAVEYRDSETGMHIIRMSHYSACLAGKAGISLDDCELVLTASPLHDIGKIGIPDAILCKPGKLTPEEWGVMKTHTTIGGELLSGANSKFMHMAKEIALTHHEKWDGSGYPEGLKGEAIPLVGRICGLCDVFDALTTKRPYKDAWPMDKTLDEIKNCKESHFDPDLVDAFFEVLPQIETIREEHLDPNGEQEQVNE